MVDDVYYVYIKMTLGLNPFLTGKYNICIPFIVFFSFDEFLIKYHIEFY